MNASPRIHLAGAGGVAGIGMTRCLSNQGYDIQGHDGSEWGTLAMECQNETEGENLHYCDMIIPVPDPLVLKYCDHANAFCPPREQVELCQDKLKSAEVLGDLAPKTYWKRESHGAGGKGAEMISEYLPGRNFSQEFVFYKGKMLAHFQKERISYLVKEKEPMVTASGSSAVSICTDEPLVFMTAANALRTLPGKLHGFYGVDLRQDERGDYKVTEINAGRLLTASYTYFYHFGYNLPLVGVKAFFRQELPKLPEYPTGWGVIRQTDSLPKFYEPKETKKWR